MSGSIKFWIGIAISVLLLALFVLTVDLGRMLDALAEANYWFLIPGIGLYLVAVFFRTMRWHVLLRHMKPISVGRLYPVVVVGYMANNLLPMRLGELVRSYYISEREGVSKTSALTTILVERVLDALILLFFIAVAALFVPLGGLAEAFGERTGVATPLLVLGFSLPFLGVFSFLLLFSFFPDRIRILALTLARPFPEKLEEPVRNLVDMFLHGLEPLRSPQTLAMLLLLSIPVWLFEAGLFILVGYAFGLNNVYENLGELVLVMIMVTAIANIGSSIPAAPGGIGLFELIARESLVLLPLAVVDRSVAAGFSTVVHAALLLPMILMGQIFLWTEHISLRRLSRAGGDERSTLGRKGPSLKPTALSVEGDE